MTDEEFEAIRERRRAQRQEQLTSTARPDDDPVDIDDPTDLTALTDEQPVVIVDFFAEWCGPCQQQTPILEAVASDTDAVVATVDIDDHPSLAQAHGVRSVPTLVGYAEGEPTEHLVGLQDGASLNQLVERLGA